MRTRKQIVYDRHEVRLELAVAVVLAVAIGMVASSATDISLAALGEASLTGPMLGAGGVLALPALAVPSVRVALLAHAGSALSIVAVAWLLSALVDQHLLGSVQIEGPAAEIVHHLAGYLALGLAVAVPQRRLVGGRTP